MILSQAVRDVRKTAQLARLAKKGDPDYPQYFANLPPQLAKAKANEQIRLDRLEVKKTSEVLQIAQIDGEGLLRAQEKAAVALLVLERHIDEQQPTARISLGGV